MKRPVVVAALAAVLLTQTTVAGEATPIEPIEEAAFTPVPDIFEAFPPPPRERPIVEVPAAKVQTVDRATAAPDKTRLLGLASWYCKPGKSICTKGYPSGGFFAAAGPKLRAALGNSWRGKTVYVNGLPVKLIDWCQCYKGQAHEKLIDLYNVVFVKTGSKVIIAW